jgi:hypothetical protein
LSQQPEGANATWRLQCSHTAAATAAAAAAAQVATQGLQETHSSGQPDAASSQQQLHPPCNKQQRGQQQQAKANPVPLLSRFGPPCEHVATLHDCWQAAVTCFPAERALGWRTHDSSGRLLQQCSWMTFAQVRLPGMAAWPGKVQMQW